MKYLLFIALAFFSTEASAKNWKSGNDLLAECTSPAYANTGMCLGYILGVVDATSAKGTRAVVGGLPTPNGVTAGQLRDIVVKYLLANPDIRHGIASDLVWIAIKAAFPNEAN